MQNSTTTAAPVNPAPIKTTHDGDEPATPAGFRWADFDAARAAGLSSDQVFDYATRSRRSDVGA